MACQPKMTSVCLGAYARAGTDPRPLDLPQGATPRENAQRANARKPLRTAPHPTPEPLGGLLRTLWRGDGDLLSLMPATAYRVPIGPLGYSRRSILILNDPALFRSVLTDPLDVYPKNDLMTGASNPS